MRQYGSFNPGEGLGGSLVHWSAQLWRFLPTDFRYRSHVVERYGARFEYHDERLLVGLEATRYDDQDEVAPFETETPGYLMLNADLRWRLVGVAAMELEMFVNASNLGDEDARKHTSFVKDSAPLPGRNYAVGIRSRF